MKRFDFTDKTDDNKASFFITNDGDIVDTLVDAEITGCAIAEVIVHGMYVGSLDDMRRNALNLYMEAIKNEKTM
jgi:hypothetical protein